MTRRRTRRAGTVGARPGRRALPGHASGVPLRVALALAVVLGACASAPPAADAPFRDARALATTPDGRLWVIDDGAVLVFERGLLADVVGGSGTGEAAFLDPVALDPTNGQALYVADRAAGAVLQFTAEGRLAATLAVPDVDPGQPLRQRDERDGVRARPVAVAAGPDGVLFVIDGARRHVLRLSAEGDVERVLGAGLLSDPVALAVAADGVLWVADAGRGRLQPFDPFGAPGDVLPVEDVGRLVSVTADGAALVVAGTEGAVVLRDRQPDGAALRLANGPARGAVLARGVLVVLAPTRLAPLGDGAVD